MIKSILNKLNIQLDSLGYYQKIYCLAEKIKEGELEYPAIKKTNNNWEQISAFDKNKGTSYWRLRGETSVNKSEVQVIPNELFLDFRYQLFLISCVKNIDNEKVAIDVIKELIKNSNSTIRQEINAFKVEIIVNEYNAINKDVYEQEYNGTNEIQLNYDYSYISFSVDILVTIRQSCLSTEC